MSQDAVHAEFHNFDWETFEEFQNGLLEILESHLESLKELDPSVTSIPAVERQQLVDQAKSFFFCTKTGHILNLDEYYTWKRINHAKIQEITDEVDEVEVKSIDQGAASNQAEVEDAPYSSNYQQLVELIVSGKPVPGIKNIPDTVLTEQKSESTASTRPKPWARSVEQDTEVVEEKGESGVKEDVEKKEAE